jgi:hypothetical protein
VESDEGRRPRSARCRGRMVAVQAWWREPWWSIPRQCRRGSATVMQHGLTVRGRGGMGASAAGKLDERDSESGVFHIF